MSVLLKSIPIIFVSFILAGCPLEGDDGATGTIDSVDLAATIATLPGVNCWDYNADGIKDKVEDKNQDGIVDAKDCHTDADVVIQNSGALYNQEKMCKMMHALSAGAADSGVFDTALSDLGCHSTPSQILPGAVQRVTYFTLRDHNFNIDNVLKLQKSTRNNTGDLIDIVIEGGFISRTIEFPAVGFDFDAACEAQCIGDVDCIASGIFDLSVASTAVHCNVFHHSDGLTTKWEQLICVTAEPQDLACQTSMLQKNIWLKSETSL